MVVKVGGNHRTVMVGQGLSWLVNDCHGCPRTVMLVKFFHIAGKDFHAWSRTVMLVKGDNGW